MTSCTAPEERDRDQRKRIGLNWKEKSHVATPHSPAAECKLRVRLCGRRGLRGPIHREVSRAPEAHDELIQQRSDGLHGVSRGVG